MDGLSTYIQQGESQVVTAEADMANLGGTPVAEAITPIPSAVTPVPAEEPTSGAGGYTAPSDLPSPDDQGVTIPDHRDEAIRQLQEQLTAQANEQARYRQQQAVESARREEAQVMAQIQAIPDEDDRNRAYTNYRLQQQQAVIQTQHAQLTSNQVQQEQTNQEVARNSVVTIRALQEGIPMEYIPLLKRSENPQELEHHIALLKRNVGQGLANSQQATRQGIVDSGVYAAGGAQTGFVPPAMPQERSGDLASLIAATPPRLASQ